LPFVHPSLYVGEREHVSIFLVHIKMEVLLVGTEPSRVALIPDDGFLSHAPWCYYGIYYGIFSVDSVPFADYLLTSAGVLRLMVTEWSLHVCGRRRMAADGVWRA